MKLTGLVGGIHVFPTLGGVYRPPPHLGGFVQSTNQTKICRISMLVSFLKLPVDSPKIHVWSAIAYVGHVSINGLVVNVVKNGFSVISYYIQIYDNILRLLGSS